MGDTFAVFVEMADPDRRSSDGLTAVAYPISFSFSQLVFVAILGFVFYSEVPDLFTWLGSTIVFLAALYLVRKEC